MFSVNSLNSVTKICYSVKGFEPLSSSHLLCKRPACYHSASTTHVRDRIFKLNPIHASVISSFPEFTEFSESSAPFRKNSNVMLRESNQVAHELALKSVKHTQGSSTQLCNLFQSGCCIRKTIENQHHFSSINFIC